VRILYFSDNISEHNRRFLTKLTEAGHDVYFLDLSSDVVEEGWLRADVTYIGHHSTFKRGSSPDSVKAFVPEFRSIIGDMRPDLIHAGPVQSCAYIAALSEFHPLVVMSWGSDLLIESHLGPEWEQATREAVQCADGFVCDCDTVRNAASCYANFPDGTIAQLPWGIKSGVFSPAGPLPPLTEMPFEADTIRIICTRSWEPLYGMDVLMQAFLRAYHNERRLRLLLLGDGSDRERIYKFITENSLSAVVLTPGLLRESELPKWFRSASAYLSCAKSDGTSVSLLQAMAVGLPVIATDIPSNREWITEDENGWLASGAADFVEKILALSRLPAVRRNAISLNNRGIVAARADWDRNFPRLLRLYERLVDSKKAVSA
jgi:L-malate glycosyltransferase